MDRGEIFLAPFTYADLQGSKRRPVCVVSSPDFNRGADVIVAMVTSSRRRIDSPTAGDAVLDVLARSWVTPSICRPSRSAPGARAPLFDLHVWALSAPVIYWQSIPDSGRRSDSPEGVPHTDAAGLGSRIIGFNVPPAQLRERVPSVACACAHPLGSR